MHVLQRNHYPGFYGALSILGPFFQVETKKTFAQ